MRRNRRVEPLHQLFQSRVRSPTSSRPSRGNGDRPLFQKGKLRIFDALGLCNHMTVYRRWSHTEEARVIQHIRTADDNEGSAPQKGAFWSRQTGCIHHGIIACPSPRYFSLADAGTPLQSSFYVNLKFSTLSPLRSKQIPHVSLPCLLIVVDISGQRGGHSLSDIQLESISRWTWSENAELR